jgi:hypothetical protein
MVLRDEPDSSGAVLAIWSEDDNVSRSHSPIDWQTSNEFASTFNRCRAPEFCIVKSSAPSSGVLLAHQGNPDSGNEF